LFAAFHNYSKSPLKILSSGVSEKLIDREAVVAAGGVAVYPTKPERRINRHGGRGIAGA